MASNWNPIDPTYDDGGEYDVTEFDTLEEMHLFMDD